MALLTAPLNTTSIASSTENDINAQREAAVVDGKAFTNENSSVTDGPAGVGVNNTAPSDRISLYTVRDGDTLSQIASMYGVSPNTILWANDLKKGTAFKTGQVLVILPISGIKYTIKKGDTVALIAKKYKTDAGEIANFNNIDDGDSLTVGDEIIIPDTEGNLANIEDTSTAPNSAKTKKKTSSNTKADNNKVDSTGYFMRPIVGGVRTQGIHGHNAVDLASSYGTPILAAASGEVIVVKTGGWDGGYGNYAVIQHPNGMQTLYAHMSEVIVSVGQSVSKGQEIGKMGSTGDSTGVHLHFEVRGGKNPF
jgi:LysM repeat protein